MEKKNIFGKVLKHLRIKKNLGQVALAKKFNVSQVIISMWENGLREPSMSNIVAIADFFNVSVDFLLGRED